MHRPKDVVCYRVKGPADGINTAPKIGSSASPGGSSASRLHRFRIHAEEPHVRSWHDSALPISAGNVRSWGAKQTYPLHARNDVNDPLRTSGLVGRFRMIQDPPK